MSSVADLGEATEGDLQPQVSAATASKDKFAVSALHLLNLLFLEIMINLEQICLYTKFKTLRGTKKEVMSSAILICERCVGTWVREGPGPEFPARD